LTVTLTVKRGLFGDEKLDGHRIPVELVAQTNVYATMIALPASKASRVAQTYCKAKVKCNRFVQQSVPVIR